MKTYKITHVYTKKSITITVKTHREAVKEGFKQLREYGEDNEITIERLK